MPTQTQLMKRRNQLFRLIEANRPDLGTPKNSPGYKRWIKWVNEKNRIDQKLGRIF